MGRGGGGGQTVCVTIYLFVFFFAERAMWEGMSEWIPTPISQVDLRDRIFGIFWEIRDIIQFTTRAFIARVPFLCF